MKENEAKKADVQGTKAEERVFTAQDVLKSFNRRERITLLGAAYCMKVLSANDIIDKAGNAKTIYNFGAYTPHHLKMAEELIKEGDFKGALNQNASFSVFTDTKGFKPVVGEPVNVVFGSIDTKNVKGAWLITNMYAIEKAASNSLSSDALATALGVVATEEEEGLGDA